MHLHIIPARSVCLLGYDVVNPFLVIAAADVVERMRYSTLPCAKKRGRESELGVVSKYQQASTVIVELITSVRSKHFIVITPFHPFFQSARLRLSVRTDTP